MGWDHHCVIISAFPNFSQQFPSRLWYRLWATR